MIKLKEYKVSQEVSIDEESYSVNLTLILFDDSNNNIPLFSKELKSISTNDQTGYEVDEQRLVEINEYIDELNS